MSLSKAIFTISLLICFPAVTVEAQLSPGDDPPKITRKERQLQSCDKEKVAKGIVAKECLQPLELSPGARVARAFQYQLSLAEQFGTISGANGTFLKAPEHYLVQHSLTFDFSQLFLTSSDFAKILKSYYEGVIAPRKLQAPVHSEPVSLTQVCPQGSSLQCIADSGAWWKRALSGVIGTFSLSERQRVVGGILVPEGSFPANYDRTGQITFDPAQLFINGSNWSGALSVLAEMRTKDHEGDFSKHETKAYMNSEKGNYAKCFGYSGTEVKSDSASKSHPLFDSVKVSNCISTFGGSKDVARNSVES